MVWLKEAAPSTELRRWFGHRPERWTKCTSAIGRNWTEIPGTVTKLRDLMKKSHVTLLYSARDTEHNQAVALRDYLQSR